jgi:heme-degrading monooxygenase HmoA
MIVRTWRGVVPRERGYYFFEYLKKTRVSDYLKIKGNLGIQALRRVEHDKTHFLVITFWDSVDSIKEFAGENYTEANPYPGDKDYFLECESVNHYDLAYTTVNDSLFVNPIDS